MQLASDNPLLTLSLLVAYFAICRQPWTDRPPVPVDISRTVHQVQRTTHEGGGENTEMVHTVSYRLSLVSCSSA